MDDVDKKGRERCQRIGHAPINAALLANLQGNTTALLRMCPFPAAAHVVPSCFVYERSSKNGVARIFMVLLDNKDDNKNKSCAFVCDFCNRIVDNLVDFAFYCN